jgi:hypothetical protein
MTYKPVSFNWFSFIVSWIYLKVDSGQSKRIGVQICGQIHLISNFLCLYIYIYIYIIQYEKRVTKESFPLLKRKEEEMRE